MKSDIISIAMGELTVTFDNEVMKAVRKVGVDVNKEELLKALDLHRSLVRCEECKYWRNKDPQQIPTASIMCGHMHPDDFCSYGEREGE